MTFRIPTFPTAVVFLAAAGYAQAAPTVSVHTFASPATASALGASQPDSITVGDGTVWVAYGNGQDSTGAMGPGTTVVQFSLSGSPLNTYNIPGLADGLKFDPTTGMVWALQNNDGNSTLSLIDPTTKTVTGPLKYAVPPYAYGPNGGSGRGYDDVAFLNGNVYMSYSNPANPSDPVVQMLNQGHTPSGTLTTTDVLTAVKTNPAFTSSTLAPPDIDSLKSTPSGQLVLTSEGDGTGPGFASSDGRYTLISNPGTATQTLSNVRVTNLAGVNVNKMDDVLFPGTTVGTLYVADTKTNTVYAIVLTGLDPNTPIISLGSFNEVGLVNPTTGIVEMSLLGTPSPHGMDFLANSTAVPEPPIWVILLPGFAGLCLARAWRRRAGQALRLAASH
jgi:hypothetical protein